MYARESIIFLWEIGETGRSTLQIRVQIEMNIHQIKANHLCKDCENFDKLKAGAEGGSGKQQTRCEGARKQNSLKEIFCPGESKSLEL